MVISNVGKGLNLEKKVEALLLPFTQNETPKILVAGGQAIAELRSEAMVKAADQYLSQCPIHINGSKIETRVADEQEIAKLQALHTLHTMNPSPGGHPEVQKVVLASVTNMTYSVDLDTLHGLFSRFGGIEKIVSFQKNPSAYQALVQFRDAADAKKAMQTLHNRNMYEGCNTLQISPSKLSEIKVKANDKAKAWDFTVEPSMPGPVSLPTYIGTQSAGQPGLQSTQAAIGPTDPQFHNMQQQHLFQHMQQLQQQNAANFAAATPDQTVLQGMFGQNNPVLICYNLDPVQSTAERIFNLFSLYGVVTKVKILREKPETALIQFSHPAYAQLARSALNEVAIFGRQIQLAFSKNADVKLPMQKPTDAAEDLKRSHEFTVRDQRHKADEAEKFQKSCPPTATIFVSNIQESVTKEEIAQLFGTVCQMNDMDLKPSKNATKKQMSVIATNSTADAINCVAYLHNYDLKGCHLKVSFSRASPNPRSTA